MTTENTSGRGKLLTHKQGGLLFKFTLLKFWEPEENPPPTISEASDIIGACMEWMKARAADEKSAHKADIVRQVRKFFPEWDGSTLAPRFRGGHKKTTSHNGHENEIPLPTGSSPDDPSAPTEDEKTEQAQPEPEEDKKEENAEPEKHAEESAAPKAKPGKSKAELLALINAGIKNIWMHGPAGCGKTTIAKEAAAELEIPCTILSCNAGTSPAEIVGFKYPEPRPSPVSRAISQPGIIVFDEMPMLDPSVAAVANALLANGEMETSTGHATRHPECVIIAAANTTGQGADRVYIGNNQLDGATLDRFTGGLITVDYDRDYESAHYDAEVCAWVWALRDSAARARLRRIVSTRAIISGAALKAAGLDWKSKIVIDWTPDERRAAGLEV